MAIETTSLGFQVPDGVELVRNGDDVIAANAKTSETVISKISGRLGQAEVNISAGGGGGPGIIEDLFHPGTYFIAESSVLHEDPVNPGFYLIGA
ncbi:hypothetical protein [Arthrobacter sp. ok362]|uniref:hypothetical protein n=1 Tax=Arthrobacter sp. ok362 TaxID=1761745 RepID=UPI00087E4643|nr:hypothetical protein [Arthrobacter sp. ok362]SDK78759.1 hypothetical protein SAMN04487913_103182 [Arthrobacter sp. ok362]